MGKNGKMDATTAAKLELGKLAIESVTQLLTLAMQNNDKANERLHASLTCERPEAVVQIAEKEMDLAENMFERAFAMLDRTLDIQEKQADARLKEAEASILRAEHMSNSEAYSAGYAAAMEDMSEDSEDDVAAG